VVGKLALDLREVGAGVAGDKPRNQLRVVARERMSSVREYHVASSSRGLSGRTPMPTHYAARGVLPERRPTTQGVSLDHLALGATDC
jgi:hypothetical protein